MTPLPNFRIEINDNFCVLIYNLQENHMLIRNIKSLRNFIIHYNQFFQTGNDWMTKF